MEKMLLKKSVQFTWYINYTMTSNGYTGGAADFHYNNLVIFFFVIELRLKLLPIVKKYITNYKNY